MTPPYEPVLLASLLQTVVAPPTILHDAFCIVRELSEEQPLRASLPRAVTLTGSSRELSPVQRWKAPLLIEVTVLGMLIDLRLEHSENAPGPTLVIPSAIVTEDI
jgi:hypothetical protein